MCVFSLALPPSVCLSSLCASDWFCLSLNFVCLPRTDSIYLSLILSVCLRLILSVSDFVCLPLTDSVRLPLIYCMSLMLSVSDFVCLSLILSGSDSVGRSLTSSVCLWDCLFASVSVCLWFCLFASDSVCLSLFLSVWKDCAQATRCHIRAFFFQVSALFLFFFFLSFCRVILQAPCGFNFNESIYTCIELFRHP